MDSGSVSVFLLTHCVREGPADTAEVCTVATHHTDKGGKKKNFLWLAGCRVNNNDFKITSI